MSIPELLAAIPSIPWSTTFAILGSLMTITFGILQMIKMIRHRFPKDFTPEVATLRNDMRSMEKTITKLHTTVHSKTVHLDVLSAQVDELKATNAHFNGKLEKLTDLIIKYFTEQR